MYRNGFDPKAAYRVCTWRGFRHGTRQYKLGDVVTVADIDDATLFTLYRFRSVEKIATEALPISKHAAPMPVSSSAQPARQSAMSSLAESVAASLEGLGINELKKLCKARGLDAHGNENTLRDRLLAMVG